MIMKKLLIVSLIAIIFVTCNKKQEERINGFTFKISCKANFKPKGIVKLYEVIAGNQKFIDSVKLEGNVDTFSFAGKQDIGSFYVMETSKGQECLFALDEQRLTITIDGSLDMPAFTVSSTKINDYYYKVEKLKMNFNTLVDSMNQSYIIAQNMADKAIIKQLELSIDTLTGTLYYALRKEFYANPLSVVSIYTANIMGYESEPELNDSLAIAMIPFMGKSLYIKNYVESIQKLNRLKIGGMAPIFDQATNDGRRLGPKDFKGKVLLLDFWASWCLPCRRSNPDLVRIYNKYKDKGFVILGISLDEDGGKWKSAIKDDKLAWDQVSDLKGWDNEVAKMYNVQEIPSAFLIDKDGKIVALGFHADELEKLLKEFL
jgi:peroxiredoxin